MSNLYELKHSQGPWKEHKYTKIENGKYVYSGNKADVTPDNSDLSKIDTTGVNIDKKNMVDIANDKLDDKGTAQIAKLLVGGLYGDAANAKKLLGKNYESIAKKADELVSKNEIDPADVKKGLEQANVLIAALSKMDSKGTTKSSSKSKKDKTSSKTEKVSSNSKPSASKTEKTNSTKLTKKVDSTKKSGNYGYDYKRAKTGRNLKKNKPSNYSNYGYDYTVLSTGRNVQNHEKIDSVHLHKVRLGK